MKRHALAALLVCALAAPLVAQQPPTGPEKVEEIQSLLNQLREILTPTLCADPLAVNVGQLLPCEYPPPPPPVYATASELNAAIAAAAPGDTLIVSNSLVYPSLLTMSKSLTIAAETVAEGRMDLAQQLPVFQDGINIPATIDSVTLRGLEIHKINHTTDIVWANGSNITLDRLRILGHPTEGAKRGIAAHSNGNLQILRSYVADCFGPYPGNDTQAILAWDMLPGLLIEDNYLEGGSETIMVGGADSTAPERDPKDITIRGNTITKKAAWQSIAVGVKNTLELKNARNVLIENNLIQYSWQGHGQDGYALALTVRNQSGTNPTATIQDVVVRNNVIEHAAAALNFLGHDNLQTSVRMARVTFSGNVYNDISSAAYSNSGITKKLILIDRAPSDLTITGEVFNSTGHTSTIYFVGNEGALSNFTFTFNQYPKTTYGMFGANVSVNQAFATYAPGGTTSPNTEIQ